ncbi:MAG: Y-family DNA polymerase [Gammaproteobacteria bacterium]
MAESGQQSLWPLPLPGSGSSSVDVRGRARAVFADPGYTKHLWISIYFNKLSFEANFNSNFEDDVLPRAVVVTEGRRVRILLCNPSAARLGIYPGQALNTALALAPDLEALDRDREAETRIMQELATWAMRFTPSVSLDPSNALLLDVRGSLRLFGGFQELRSAIVDGLAERGYRFRLACAPTALAALWFAKSGCDAAVFDRAELPGQLGDLSIDCIGWPADTQRMLTGIGVVTVGECIRLPRDGLARRLGPTRLAELDQAFGARPEPRTFHQPPRSFDAHLDLPVETTDAALVVTAMQKLLARLEAFLRRHQGAVQLLWIRLYRRDAPPMLERVGLLRASADTAYLLELAGMRLDAMRLDAPVVAVGLYASMLDAPPACGEDLLGDQQDRRENALALVEQLRVRLGADAVHGIRSVPEHRPEAAWRRVAFSARAATRRDRAGVRAMESPYAPVSHRPVWMLEEPKALYAPDGRPVFGDTLEFEGDPERIETGWWDGRDIRRDYYVARDQRGIRFWVFRDCRESRWYLHGLFG